MTNLLLFPIDDDTPDKPKPDGSTETKAKKPKKPSSSGVAKPKSSGKKSDDSKTAASRKERLLTESDKPLLPGLYKEDDSPLNSESKLDTGNVALMEPISEPGDSHNSNTAEGERSDVLAVVPAVTGMIDPQDLPTIENKLIRASAGTGKTYQLTSRYLRLLLLGVAPETILATTFTRKAAGEILDRVVQWLGQAARDDAELAKLAQAVDIPDLTQDRCREKLALLTRQMHRLRVCTIDAFFIQMALSFSLELGLTPGWQILDEGGQEGWGLRDEAVSGVLRQESLDDLLVLRHQMSPKGEAKRGLDGMLKSRVDEAYRLFLDSSPDAWNMINVPAPLPDDELEDVVRALRCYPTKGKQIPAAIEADLDRIGREDWRGFFNGGATLAKYVSEGKVKYGSAKIPPELSEIYERFIPHLRSMILQSASSQTRGTHRFLTKYHDQYDAVKSSKRLYGFQEITDLLAKQSQTNDLDRFAFRMDAGIDHLLLDEFQDTSIPQWKALSKLAERCTADEPGRSFFCVGDVKQAIYGWRGGTSEIFDVLGNRLPNLNASELKESRRSSPIIIDAVNHVFRLLPDWDPKKLGRAERAATCWEFPKHTTHLEDLPGYFSIETSGETGPGKETQEAAVFRRAAERVSAIYKQAKGRSIGILCRKNDKVGQMMNELQRLKVPASEEGGNFLTDSAAVELILSLLHLTDHPGDSISAYHLATSPWAKALGLEVDACEEYWSAEPIQAASDKSGDVEAEANQAGETLSGSETSTNNASNFETDASKSETSTPAAKPAREPMRPPAGIDLRAINALTRKARRQLLDDGFGNTIQAWSIQLREFCNQREARRLTQLVEKAYEYQGQVESPSQLGYEYQRRKSIRPTEFVRYIRKTKFSDPSNDTIRVMTVHQAKGLEFDVVVLPDLLGPFVDGHDTFLNRRKNIESDIDLVCRYMGKDSGRSFLPDEFQPLFDDFEDRRARDSFCVLYVAMTRAIHALHIFLPSGMQLLRMPKGHAGYLVKDTFVPGEKLEPETVVYEAGDKHWFMEVDAKPDLPEDRATPLPAPRLAKSNRTERNLETIAPSQIGANRYVDLSVRMSRGKDEAREFGSLLHLWLSNIVWMDADVAVPDDATFSKLAESFADKTSVPKALKQFRKMIVAEPLKQILNKQQYLDDLQSAMPSVPQDIRLEVRCEQPVAGRDGNTIITGTIDRLVLVRAGDKIVAAEIIDYKTDQEGKNDSDTLNKKRERYESQMGAYRRVIASSLRLPSDKVVSRLVFL